MQVICWIGLGLVVLRLGFVWWGGYVVYDSLVDGSAVQGWDWPWKNRTDCRHWMVDEDVKELHYYAVSGANTKAPLQSLQGLVYDSPSSA